MELVLAAGILGGCLIFCVVWWQRGEVTKEPVDSGNSRVTIEEVEGLVGRIGETITHGIRTALGLDLAGGVVKPEEEQQEPEVFIHELEMDPFMREMEEAAEFALPEGFTDERA